MQPPLWLGHLQPNRLRARPAQDHSSDARTSVTPAFASSLAFAESVLRVTARTS